ncbi:Transcription factor IIS [Vigna unguiculata]|uniref:Transcription factor IIS n=1 Tax=Vigna unguiculata TaxID=3917 RepID=A0A4D6NQX7_VIGUN|nr:Transcription factor IIS [Vigna unguiculata]
MHGRGGEKGTRHMWKAPTRDSTLNADVSSSSSSTVKSFFKDRRKISVGECALFKPSEDRPPYIGIIRYLTIGKDKKLKFGVSWLYRSIEVKLSKGVPLEAAPNEVFYTFHKDEIDAEALLHPCKVAFLPKGAELQPGISSFLCRRVYDIANKCLWWLNDQDYINDCQEEVDKLLYRNCVEMHATVQPGGRSPKPMSSPTSTSQLKSASDSVQNSTSSFPSHIKGRKRERADQGSESAKRERSIKTEDGDSGNFRHDNFFKTEIAKITEKGGLVDGEGVEKLVQLMVPDRNEKKIDLASRSLLAAVVAATDKLDCLSQFVQQRGLPVFDEWLQEVHKGKIGDGDKSAEEFLLVLLRALDKLPVNLQALQTCNIGKSVNHLRSHKNAEIQRKARGLVDTWKKRVEAEMNINDAKSGSGPNVHWPAKSRPSDVGQGGNRHSGASSDVAMKSSVTQLSASKTTSVKVVQGENITRSASTSAFPGPAKSVPSPAAVTANLKDGQPRIVAVNGGSDLPMANVRDEKSCSSSQSHNNSQSCSSDHAKTGGHSVKEDARSSTAMSANKISGGSSRHRKSINGFSGSSPSGGQRETGSSRNSSSHKNITSEKISQPGLMDKAVDGTSLEGNIPKLIVKIPNQGRSPAQSVSAGSFDDPTIMNSRASSPVLPEKHDQSDNSPKEKNDLYRVNIGSDINTESWQSNDFKEVLTGSDEGDGSPAAVTDEEHCRTGNDCKKALEVSKAASSSSGNENKAGNLQDASYSSINALIEGVKYSEADDGGMNLLASVAAGEILKSELLTPAGSPERNTPTVEQSCTDNGVKCSEENLVRDECHSNNGLDVEHKNLASVTGDLGANDESDSDFQASGGKAARELNKRVNACTMDLQQVAETMESKGKLNEKSGPTSLGGFAESSVQEAGNGDGSKQLQEVVQGVNSGEIHDKINCVADVEAEVSKKLSNTAVEVDVQSDNCAEGSSGSGQTVKRPPAILVQSDLARGKDDNGLHSSGSGVDKVPKDCPERESDKTDDVDAENHVNQSRSKRNESESDSLTMPENRGTCSIVTGLVAEHVEENLETKIVRDQPSREDLPEDSPGVVSQEINKHHDSKRLKLTSSEAEEAEECTSTTADASSMSAAAVSDADAKVEFDLNEGLNADDGRCEFNSIANSGCAPSGRLISPVPFPASSISCGILAPVTLASAAKGHFVPPEDLLRSKGEIGWKGSAATSAFRPAEPRKVMEMPFGTSATPIPDAPAGKQSRAPLDIDLNVADERILDDISCARHTNSISLATDSHDPVCSKIPSPVRSSGGLGLDLNQVDDASDMGICLNINHKIDVPTMQGKSSLGGPPIREVNVHRDFDLNNGPSVEEITTESSLFSPHARSNVTSQLPVSGLRVATAEPGNFSWLPSSGNTYSAVTISSIMPDRGDQPFSIVAPNGPQRLLTPAAGGNPFGPDIYRTPVLSSSPAVSYPSAPFEYPVFPFNSSFPLPSASFSAGSTTYVYPTSANRLCFPAVNSQLMGPAGTVSSHYPRPYVVGLPEGNNSGSAETSRKWTRQGLDLNAGPGCSEMEGRDESSPLPSRQLSVASSQALAEEQARIQLAGSVRKRKEPDGGWDGYNQSSWQ